MNAEIVPPSPPASEHELVLKVIPMPADCNPSGDIFGGWVMAQVDLAGAVLPMRLARGRVATIAVKEFLFKHPVRIGDLLSFHAHVTRIGTSSITVVVEVFAEAMSRPGEHTAVTHATLIYVAVDAQGQPRPLTPA